MSRYIRALVLVGSLLAASQVEAAIVISEIAWMGTDMENGSSCEWIELHNPDSSAVNISGWTLNIANAGGSTPKVMQIAELESGSSTVIEPGGFYILARNSGVCLESSPGKDADWFGSFGTGISNSGSVLTLLDSAGITTDTVDAADGWGDVGGYNVSGKPKLTPQRNGNTWVTATPSPGAVNATQSEERESSTSSSSSSSSSSKKVTLPKIYVEAGEDRVVTAGAHVKYNALVYTDRGSIVDTAQIVWAFGEGSTEHSQGASHMYRKPGEYVVNVRGEQGWKTAEDSFIVTVDTAQVRIAEVTEEGITLENFDDRVLDLSHWKFEANGIQFKIPDGTFILPERTVFFSNEVTELPESKTAALLYPNGKKMHEYNSATPPAVEGY